MGTLLLVRHSKPRIDPALPPSKWSLGKEGHDLCKPLSEALARHEPSIVVASKETKATETGRTVAHLLHVPFETADDLQEIDRSRLPHFADPLDLDVAMKEFFASPNERLLGRESAASARSRFSSAVHGVLKRHPKGNAVIVSHGTVISLLASAANGLDAFPLWKRLGLPSFLALETPSLRLLNYWPENPPTKP